MDYPTRSFRFSQNAHMAVCPGKTFPGSGHRDDQGSAVDEGIQGVHVESLNDAFLEVKLQQTKVVPEFNIPQSWTISVRQSNFLRLHTKLENIELVDVVAKLPEILQTLKDENHTPVPGARYIDGVRVLDRATTPESR